MEKNIVYYNGRKIEYEIKKAKIKNIYIHIKDESVIVKAPYRVNKEAIYELVEKKKKWIYNALNKQKLVEDRSVNLINKSYIFILDKKVNVQYENRKIKNIDIDINNETCYIYLPLDFKLNVENIKKIENKLDEKIKNIASNEISLIMNKYSKITGLYPNKVTVKKFKRIWGNCSSKKEIKINQNIIRYGKDEIEYVCLHEIAHLKYMNHKKEFWNFISKYMPDYKERANRLKR